MLVNGGIMVGLYYITCITSLDYLSSDGAFKI
jgi:hypothetical protein